MPGPVVMKVPLLEGLGVLCGTRDTLTSSTCLGFPSHTPHVPCPLDVQCPGRGSRLGRCQEVSERTKLSRHRCDIWERKATSEALHSLWWGARHSGLIQHMLPGALVSRNAWGGQFNAIHGCHSFQNGFFLGGGCVGWQHWWNVWRQWLNMILRAVVSCGGKIACYGLPRWEMRVLKYATTWNTAEYTVLRTRTLLT